VTDWGAAIDGWMIWRWAGPRMRWHSDLISPWNPILAQSLTLDELGWRPPSLGDWELWTADAIRTGEKTGGYFDIRPRRDLHRWVLAATAAGMAVTFREIEAICGLALGYPPEVTAGLLLGRAHRGAHRPDVAEYGAYCPLCDRRRLADLARRPATSSG
jgi:hypothetical protein